MRLLLVCGSVTTQALSQAAQQPRVETTAAAPGTGSPGLGSLQADPGPAGAPSALVPGRNQQLLTTIVTPRQDAPTPPDPMLEPLSPAPHVLTSWAEAIRHVRSRSTDLVQARSQVEYAANQARLALAAAYPTVTATGQVRHDILFDTTTNLPAAAAQAFGNLGAATIWSANVSVRQPLYAPKAWFDAETADVRAHATALQVKDAERRVLAATAEAIVSAVTAERLAEVSRLALRSALSTLDLTRRRTRLGAGSALDVLRAEQEVVATRAQLVAANEGIRKSREALGLTLGYPHPWSVTPDIKLNGLISDAARICTPLTDLDNRADLNAQRQQVQVQRRGVEASSWLLAPSVTLQSDVNYTNAPFTTNGKPVQWLIAGVLTVPLYDGGVRHAQRASAAANTTQQEAILEQQRRQAVLEVQQAQRAIGVAEQNLEVSTQARDLTTQTANLARLSFVNGQATSFELVDATRRQQAAELDLTVKEFEVVRARILALLANANCQL